MQISTNLRRKRTISPTMAWAAVYAGILIVLFTPPSGHDDGWFDPKFWLLVGGVGLVAWGSLQRVRKRLW